MILVPLGFLACLPSDQVEAILLHELAHIRRSDYLVNIFQRIVEGLFFHHPAVWWISHVVRQEREHCCDDIVVAYRGDAPGYAAALAALEENRTHQIGPQGEAAVAATGGNLTNRVRRLLYPKTYNVVGVPALAAILLMASTAIVFSANHLKTDSQLAGPWQKWLHEDVVYIISDQEKSAFLHLKTDQERQHFVDQFWTRREASGATNKEEHYRRIEFADKHWGEKKADWRTDRGRIYILHGPPDEIDSHPSASRYERPASEGGGVKDTYPFEFWRYRSINGKLQDFEFVDRTLSNEFRLATSPNEKYKD